MGKQEPKKVKKHICVGLLAHVDAGKTTFCEQILYRTHSIRKLGRVDHKDSFMDYHKLEKERGITIFSEQAVFEYEGDTYYLLDTPGHVDFSAEMERTIQVLDYGIVLVNAAEGVPGHLKTIWRLLEQYNVPVLLFGNKMDQEGCSREELIQKLRKRLSEDICGIYSEKIEELWTEEQVEWMAERDDALLLEYLTSGYEKNERAHYNEKAKWMIKNRRMFPCFFGSARNGEGMDEFLKFMGEFTVESKEKEQGGQKASAYVYKVRHDSKGTRLVYLKIREGTLQVKDEISVMDAESKECRLEKINQIRIYNGEKYEVVQKAEAGELCAVTGLQTVRSGDLIGKQTIRKETYIKPMLQAGVLFSEEYGISNTLRDLRILEDEDPLLRVSYKEQIGDLQVHIMGGVQLEVLQEIYRERFGQTILFGTPKIEYQETIAQEVIGYGHYEPLKHYAEVQLRMLPGKRNSGITFESLCTQEELGGNYQRLVSQHVFEGEHCGVLTGSTITDVHIQLIHGRAHLKHTEGGDFRQAVRRAVRQGLCQADTILLEPYYSIEIEAPISYMGRILSDIQKLYGSFEAPIISAEEVIVAARGPVATFLSYPLDFVSYTGGQGSISMRFDGYEPCHNTQDVVREYGYEAERDLEHPSSSIFCSHGAGFEVKWMDVPSYVHCK